MVKIQVDSQGKAYYTSDGKALVSSSGRGDTINIKNGHIHGAVTLDSNGNASNFSSANYIDSYFNGFIVNNFEIEIKFTTGNDVTSDQMIFMLYGYQYNDRTKNRTEELRFQIYGNRFYLAQFLNGDLPWAADAYTGYVQSNTTYWLKCVGTNNYQTYYVKEENGDYQVIHTQSTSNPNPFNYLVVGRELENIISGNPRPFNGTVYLADTYIKCNGVEIWRGSDIQIKQNDVVKFAKKQNIIPIRNIGLHNNLVFGFSADDNVYCFKFPSSGSDFTFYGRFTYQPNNGGQSAQVIYEFWNPSNSSSQYCISLYDNKLCVQGYTGVTTLEVGKTYDFKIEWNGSSNITQYIKESTSDVWITDCIITDFSNGSSIFDYPVYLGVNKVNGYDQFNGSMDLNYFKVTQGQNTLWEAIDSSYSSLSGIVPVTYGNIRYPYFTNNANVEYYTGIATGNVSSGLYEVSTVLG